MAPDESMNGKPRKTAWNIQEKWHVKFCSLTPRGPARLGQTAGNQRHREEKIELGPWQAANCEKLIHRLDIVRRADKKPK